jgi:Spy/CpxP family protein refolding chaperone
MRSFGYRHLFFALVVGLAGGAAIGMHAHRWLEARWHSGAMTPRIVDRLGRKLDLTPDQRVKLTGILTRTHERLEALRAEARMKSDAAFDASAAEIEKILTPEQVVKFKAIRARMEARRRMHGPPPPGA